MGWGGVGFVKERQTHPLLVVSETGVEDLGPGTLLGVGRNGDPKRPGVGEKVNQLRSVLTHLGVKHEVSSSGDEIRVLTNPTANHSGRRLPDGSLDIPTHVSDGGGPTDIRRQRESRSNALVTKLHTEEAAQ